MQPKETYLPYRATKYKYMNLSAKSVKVRYK